MIEILVKVLVTVIVTYLWFWLGLSGLLMKPFSEENSTLMDGEDSRPPLKEIIGTFVVMIGLVVALACVIGIVWAF